MNNYNDIKCIKCHFKIKKFIESKLENITKMTTNKIIKYIFKLAL